MMRAVMLTCAFVVGVLLTGCATTHPARIDDREKPYQERSRIQWNSRKLGALLRIDKAAADRSDTGLMQVRLAIRNRTRKNIWVDIRTLFTDQSGFELEKTNWEPICCIARTVTTYEAVSLGPQAHDYQVIIRDARVSQARP